MRWILLALMKEWVAISQQSPLDRKLSRVWFERKTSRQQTSSTSASWWRHWRWSEPICWARAEAEPKALRAEPKWAWPRAFPWPNLESLSSSSSLEKKTEPFWAFFNRIVKPRAYLVRMLKAQALPKQKSGIFKPEPFWAFFIRLVKHSLFLL